MKTYIVILVLTTCVLANAGYCEPTGAHLTEQSIKDALKTIHTKEDAIKHFGKPLTIDKGNGLETGLEVLYYDFSNFIIWKEGRHILSGFELYVKDRKVVHWEPVYSEFHKN